MLHLEEHIASKTHVLWDWNGTLLDDVSICVEIVSRLAENHGLPPISRDFYLAHFRFPVADYYRDVGFDFARESFAKLSDDFQRSYRESLHLVQLHEGALDLLSLLCRRGIQNCILSASHQDDLDQFLRRYNVHTFVSHAFGVTNYEASSKLARGHELIASLAVPRDQIVMIGDTEHDAEVGEALGIDVLMVTGGHQSEERLLSILRGQRQVVRR